MSGSPLRHQLGGLDRQWGGTVEVLTCDPGFAVDGKPTVDMTCSNDAEWPAKPWLDAQDVDQDDVTSR